MRSGPYVTLSAADLGRLLNAATRGRRRRALGVDEITAPEPVNRLLPLTVSAILDRADIVGRNPGDILRATDPRRLKEPFKVGVVNNPPGSVADPAVRAALKEIEKAPTAEEIVTLGLIDFFFSPDNEPSHGGRPPWMSGWAPASYLLCQPVLPSNTFKGGVSVEVRRALLANPFFCPPKPSGLSVDVGMAVYSPPPYTNSASAFFNLSALQTWSALRMPMVNTLNILKLFKSYPFPAVASLPKGNWLLLEQNGLRELAWEPGVVTQDIARFFVTMSLAANWNTMVAKAQDYIEDKAKREKWKAIALTVALTAFGAVVGWAITSALIVKGVAAASTMFSNQQTKDMAAGLKDLAGQLGQTEPSFAAQLEWNNQFIENMLLYPDAPKVEDIAPPPPEASAGASTALKAIVGLGLPTVISGVIAAIARR